MAVGASTALVDAQAGWSNSMLHVYQQIKHEFPKRYKQARRVAWCESHWQRYAHNPSGASGIFQLMPYWWDGSSAYHWRFNPYNVDRNIHYAHELFRRSGFTWRQWTCQPWDGPIRF